MPDLDMSLSPHLGHVPYMRLLPNSRGLDSRKACLRSYPVARPEGVQDLAPLLAARPPLPRRQLLGQLVPLPDPYGLSPLTANLRRAALAVIPW
jgi:hypothetical protein